MGDNRTSAVMALAWRQRHQSLCRLALAGHGMTLALAPWVHGGQEPRADVPRAAIEFLVSRDPGREGPDAGSAAQRKRHDWSGPALRW